MKLKLVNEYEEIKTFTFKSYEQILNKEERPDDGFYYLSEDFILIIEKDMDKIQKFIKQSYDEVCVYLDFGYSGDKRIVNPTFDIDGKKLIISTCKGISF